MKNRNSFPKTKMELRAAVDTLPDDARFQMLLGLDGDCDFSRCVTDFIPYLCSKSELLELIERKAAEQLQSLPHDQEYLVLGRRHAVCARGLLDTRSG